MIIIAGLGNPGDRYEQTRHNVGFQVLDYLIEGWRLSWKSKKFHSLIAEKNFGDDRVLLLKPQTFMNESGQAVAEAVTFYKVPLDHLLVVYDDLALPLGALRFVQKGSAGGHNGIKSIISHCGGDGFHRLKVGISHPGDREAVVSYVLSPFSKGEQKMHEEIVHKSSQAVESYIQNGLQVAMNQFNGSTL